MNTFDPETLAYLYCVQVTEMALKDVECLKALKSYEIALKTVQEKIDKRELIGINFMERLRESEKAHQAPSRSLSVPIGGSMIATFPPRNTKAFHERDVIRLLRKNSSDMDRYTWPTEFYWDGSTVDQEEVDRLQMLDIVEEFSDYTHLSSKIKSDERYDLIDRQIMIRGWRSAKSIFKQQRVPVAALIRTNSIEWAYSGDSLSMLEKTYIDSVFSEAFKDCLGRYIPFYQHGDSHCAYVVRDGTSAQFEGKYGALYY